MPRVLPILACGFLWISAMASSQTPLKSQLHSGIDEPENYHVFKHPIKRVAVIGAGANGLQQAAVMLDHGFEVRLFERAPMPGGVWLYTDMTPIPAPFPNEPIKVASFKPDIPETLPLTRYYSDGDDDLSIEWRMREHWTPSSAWAGLTSTLPPQYLTLPNMKHPDNMPWKMTIQHLQKHVRQYASSVELNSNDFENAHSFSYSTRVERVHKAPGSQKWTLNLRKMERVPGSDKELRVDYWTEEFDAVVVSNSNTEADSPWVPAIPGLDDWANTFQGQIIHSREYRRPEKFTGKNVLILGGATSGSGIALDLAAHAASISISLRAGALNHPIVKAAATLYPQNASLIAEVESFDNVDLEATSLKDAVITLVNGTTVTGYDYIILATGYRKSLPFLADFHNSTIRGFEEPEVEIAPIITDGTHRRSLHWTGHYIPDPTLALSTVEPWDMGTIQALAFAKSWSGKARLPSIARMWEEYPGAGKELETFFVKHEVVSRLFITWLNVQNLQFGGKLINEPEVKYKYREALDYFGRARYGGVDFIPAAAFDQLENMPRSEWPSRQGVKHWAEVTDSW